MKSRRLSRPARYLCFTVLLALAPAGFFMVMRSGPSFWGLPLLAAALLVLELYLFERDHPWSITPRRFRNLAFLLLFGALLLSVFALGYATTLF